MEVSPEPTDLRLIVAEVKQLFAQRVREKDLEFHTEFGEDFPRTIVIDEVRLRQILLNIVGNAVKFTHKGFIKVKVYLINDKNGIINFQIAILDTGIGISDEYKAKIFESFSQQSGQDTRKYGGTGLGLSISKRLCELMGGSISLESKLGEGTSFYITFQDIKYSDEIIESDESYLWDEESVDFTGSKILIVDDVAYNRSLVLTYLDKYNLGLFEADNGEMAVQMMSVCKPNFVFMDIRMPGMSGYEATEQIKAIPEYSKVPIVALTASTMKSELDRINSLFDGFLRKPVQKKTLIKEMTKHLPFIEIERKIDIQETQVEIEDDKPINDDIKKSFVSMFADDIHNSDSMFIDELGGLAEKIKDFADENSIPQLKKRISEINNSIEAFEFDRIPYGLKNILKMFE